VKLIRFHQMNVKIFKNIFMYIRYRIQIVQIIIALSFALSYCWFCRSKYSMEHFILKLVFISIKIVLLKEQYKMKNYLNSQFFGECRNCTLSLQVLKLMSGVWASCCMHYCVAICHLMMIILTVCIGKSWWVLFHSADRKFLVYMLFLGLEI